MYRQLSDIVNENEVHDLQMFLYELGQGENKHLLSNDLLLNYETFYKKLHNSDTVDEKSSLYRLLRQTPEVIIEDFVLLSQGEKVKVED